MTVLDSKMKFLLPAGEGQDEGDILMVKGKIPLTLTLSRSERELMSMSILLSSPLVSACRGVGHGRGFLIGDFFDAHRRLFIGGLARIGVE